MTGSTPCLVAALVATLLGPAAPAEAQGGSSEARALFVEASALLRDGRHEAACERLERVLGAVDAPNVRWNLAYCRRSLGQNAAAGRHLQAFVRGAPPADPRVALAARLLSEIDARTATLTVRVAGPDDDLAVMLGGEPLPAAALGRPHRVDPGRIIVRLTRGPHTVQSHVVDLAAREWRTVELTSPPVVPVIAPVVRPLDPPAERTPPRRRRVALFTAGAVVLAAAAATFAAVRVSGRDDRLPLPEPVVTVQTR
jgi:hypothetical protein